METMTYYSEHPLFENEFRRIKISKWTVKIAWVTFCHFFGDKEEKKTTQSGKLKFVHSRASRPNTKSHSHIQNKWQMTQITHLTAIAFNRLKINNRQKRKTKNEGKKNRTKFR